MSFLHKLKSVPTVPRFSLWLIAAGVLLRLGFYLSNPSVWGDEGWVIFEIVYRTFNEILFPTKYFNLAPPGFTFLEKFIYTLIGSGEYALRLLPLLSSFLGIFLFYRLLVKNFSRPGLTICALFLFCFCSQLIYYAAEIKPYSTDILLTLLIYMLVFSVRSPDVSLFSVFLIGLIGAAALWFSYASIFILSGVGLALMITALTKKQLSKTRSLLVVFMFWLISFSVLYKNIISHLKDEPEVRIWKDHFISNVLSWEGLRSAGSRFIELFKEPAGFPLPILAFIVFLIGCISIFKNDKNKFNLLFFPIAVTFLTFLLGKYPFAGRTILFLLPMVFIFIAEGLARLMLNPKTQLPGMALCLLLFLPFFSSTATFATNPPKNGDMRPAMQYLKAHIQDNDIVCLNNAASWPFWYYLISLGFEEKDRHSWILSDDHQFKNSLPYARATQMHWELNYKNRFNEKIDTDIKDIDQNNLDVFPKNKRAWFLISNVPNDFEDFLISYLDLAGTKTQEFKSNGSSVYLYDLTKRP